MSLQKISQALRDWISSPRVPSKGEDTKAYDDWKQQFILGRLQLFVWLCLLANLMFYLADFLLYRPHALALFPIRTTMEAGLILCLLLLRSRIGRRNVALLFLGVIWIGGFGIVHMTVLLGGFQATYYQGLNLVFLAAAVVVSADWRLHFIAQAVTLIYYYGVNLRAGEDINAHAAIENGFVFFWISVATLVAVTLFERLQRAQFEGRRELEISNEKLLELDRLKSEFFANLSHELRTPLTLSIAGYKALLNASLLSPYRDIATTGLRNAARLVTLIDELLDLAKFDTGHALLKKRSFDLAALVRDVASNFESSARQRIVCSGADATLAVEADPRQIKKVLYNLLSNAFKFSDPEQGRASIRVHKNETQVELEVEDNGIGIPYAQLNRIFERFTQVEGSQTRRFGGVGIGLALVKEIVALHGGGVTVESELGKGSLFRVTLPIGRVSTQPFEALEEDESEMIPLLREGVEAVPELETDGAPVEESAPLLLVADDNPDMRAYLKRLLSGLYRVVVATDGAEALDKAERLHPALILTDVMMPRMSGNDLLKAVRGHERLRSVPIIFLTAKAGSEARIESLEAGANDYVSKPFHEEELLARINNQLRMRAQEKEIEARTIELERLNRQLEAVNATLREVNQRKSEFVSIVSHDLRSPMAAIQGYVDNMQEGLAGGLSEKQGYYLTRMKANIERVTRMINDLLNLTKIETGQIEIRLQSVSMGELIDHLLEGVEPTAHQKHLKLKARYEPGLPAVQCDPDKVTQILTNLIQNAIKFTASDGEVRVEVETSEGQFMRICVADTGCGIPSSELHRVFDKFYRGSSAQSEVRGTGLGLAIAKHLVELQHGTIWVESRPGEGTRFFFTLPLSKA